ncbi:hypothetical protein SALBM311S_04093 [Streptomyces alboniger]
MFVDHDDWLGDEALERMYDYGKANNPDVVIGKMAGIALPGPAGAVPGQPAARHGGERAADRQPHPAQDVPGSS